MKMQIKNVSLLFVVVVVLALSGCATVPRMPERADVAAKRFSPPPHKANLYIIRPNRLAYAVLFQVYLNGKLAGSIATNTYFLFEVEPGKHQIVVVTGESHSVVTMDLRDGENYFIDVIPKFGLIHARAELKKLSPEEGRKAVMGTKRIEPLMLSP
jgi:hypothetical protein